MIEPSGYDPVDLICLGIAVALLLRQLTRMERFYWPRVVILTFLLWVPTVYLFLLCFGSLPATTCEPSYNEPETFTLAAY